MKAYRHLVKHALSKGQRVSVFDGEEWTVKRSNKFGEIVAEIEAVEEAQIRIYPPDAPGCNGWALVSAYGLADDETVMDWTDTEWMTEWFEAYEETLA